MGWEWMGFRAACYWTVDVVNVVEESGGGRWWSVVVGGERERRGDAEDRG